MKNRYQIAWLCLLLASMFGACKETPDNFTPDDPGLDYYPLEIGKFIEYEMDSTVYDPNGDSLVNHYKSYVREEIVDTLTDNLGNVLYKIEHFERGTEGEPWAITKVFSAGISDDQAIRNEDNLRFIKLTFPIKKTSKWKGNQHFDENLIVTVAGEKMEMFKGWEYDVQEVGQPAAVGTFQFDATTTVQEADNENLIELRQSKAVYAKGVGLVYRELRILDTQCIDNCAGKPWEEKAEKGFILKQTILHYN